MEVGRFVRAGLAVATAMSMGAVSLTAQVVTYSTSGAFSGGTGLTTCSATQCTVDGFTLTFSGDAPASYMAPTLVDLGQFVTSFATDGGTAGLTAFTGVNFTLTILQTSPSGGS